MKVWTEQDSLNNAIRIFRTKKAAFSVSEGAVVHLMEKSVAVGQIREAVYLKQEGKCYDCGIFVTKRGHMHEKNHRGQTGEISLDNSVISCAKCHIIGRGSAHGDRSLRFSKKKDT